MSPFQSDICCRYPIKNYTNVDFEFKSVTGVSFMQQSLSGTADHDPLLGLPLTPTKWHICQECDDEARSSQISPAQLLSNKLGKHAKIE